MKRKTLNWLLTMNVAAIVATAGCRSPETIGPEEMAGAVAPFAVVTLLFES